MRSRLINVLVNSSSSCLQQMTRSQLSDFRKKLDTLTRDSYNSMPLPFFSQVLNIRRTQAGNMLDVNEKLMIYSCVANQI